MKKTKSLKNYVLKITMSMTPILLRLSFQTIPLTAALSMTLNRSFQGNVPVVVRVHT